jgi:hypothetical protein
LNYGEIRFPILQQLISDSNSEVVKRHRLAGEIAVARAERV